MLAALFMVTGICVLLFLGREKARIIGQTITELDIQPLLNVDQPLTQDDMKGKIAVIHFWGFWSVPCVNEYPDFVAVYRKYKDDGDVIFVSIACSEKREPKNDSLLFYTKQVLSKMDALELPVYHDPAEYSRTQISQLLTVGGFSYPTTLVVDGLGQVVDVWRSGVSQAALEKAIEKAKKATGRS